MRLHPKIIDLELARTLRLLNLVGNPERKLPPVIHVAGTNGKGSVIAYLRAMLEAAGSRVHVYTSPHLVRFHERIRLAGELIEEQALVALIEECERANGGDPITFFEITTVAAFLAFTRDAGRHPAAGDRPRRRVRRHQRDRQSPRLHHHADLVRPHAVPRQLAGQDRDRQGRHPEIRPPGDRRGTAAGGRCCHRTARRRAGRAALALRDRMEFRDRRFRLHLSRCARRDRACPGRSCPAGTSSPMPPRRSRPRAVSQDFALSEKAIAAGLANAIWPARMQRLTRGPLVDLLPQRLGAVAGRRP